VKEERLWVRRCYLCPGRLNARWLQKLSDRFGIKYIYDMVEVGVRVEFPATIMKRQAEALYETVYRVRTKTYKDIVRTFCSCPNGMVAIESMMIMFVLMVILILIIIVRIPTLLFFVRYILKNL
jgi:uncharacterized FAD-dependent dehydrogenase